MRLLTSSACGITGPPDRSVDGSEKNVNAAVPAPAVRFASKVEEYESDGSSSRMEPTKEAPSPGPQLPEVTAEQIKALSQSLADTKLQEQRMKSFSYQAFSLPASRVC
jgi:hypothetical protein